MRRPTSREPVNETKRVLGCCTSTSPTAAPLPVSRVKLDSGEAGLEQHLGELGGDGRGLARRLDHDGIAGDQRRHGHARQNGEREIPWRNHHAHAEREVDHLVAARREAAPRAAGRPAAASRGRSTRRSRWLRRRRPRLPARSCRLRRPARRRTRTCGRAGGGRPRAAGATRSAAGVRLHCGKALKAFSTARPASSAVALW